MNLVNMKMEDVDDLLIQNQSEGTFLSGSYYVLYRAYCSL